MASLEEVSYALRILANDVASDENVSGFEKLLTYYMEERIQYTTNMGNDDILSHILCQNGRYDLLRILLDHYENDYDIVNEQDRQGNTPLHYTAYSGSTECAMMLLQTGTCDKDIRNIWGNTAEDDASFEELAKHIAAAAPAT